MLKSDSMKRSCIWNFKPVETGKKLPKTWEEFCEMFPVKKREFFITNNSLIKSISNIERTPLDDQNLLPDPATAFAVLALCQLIQLRNAFNGDWVPDWSSDDDKFMIEFINGDIIREESSHIAASPLYFKNMVLRDEFLRYFRPLIEKSKPLYGMKEVGEE